MVLIATTLICLNKLRPHPDDPRSFCSSHLTADEHAMSQLQGLNFGPCDLICFKLRGIVEGTGISSCELFMEQVPVTTPVM